MIAQLDPRTLQNLDLFAGMSEADISKILNACQQFNYPAGATIYESGQEQRSLCVLLEGALQVDLEVPKVGERVIVDLAPPSVFGEMSFFHPAPHSATVKCVQDAQVLCLDRANFDLLLASGSRAAARLAVNAAALLAARLATTDEWVAQVLEEQQTARIRDKWREFRAGMNRAFQYPRGMIGVGTGF